MPSSKPRTARAVEINAGTQKQFEKRLSKLSRAFSLYVANEIISMLDDQLFLAKDAKPRHFKKKDIGLKLKDNALSQKNFIQEILDNYVSLNLLTWIRQFSDRVKKTVVWYVRNLTRDVSATQRRSLLAAGFPPDYLKEKWTVPVVRGQYISPEAAELLPEIIEEATNLITKMQASDVERLQEVIAEGLLNGQDIKKVRDTLHSFEGFDLARAKRVALDQSIKINQAIQRANCKSIGVTHAVWVHVPGKFTSRKTHIEMNGKEFDLSEGLYDKDVNEKVMPGQLPFCRCGFRMVLPKYFTTSK